MKNYPALLLSFALLLTLFACSKKKTGSDAPEIALREMSKDSIKNGLASDTITLQIYIKDKNGDLVSDADAIFFKDSRDSVYIPYAFPEIDPAILNGPDGIDGNIYFFLKGDAVLVRDDSIYYAQGDTLHYDVYVKDAAGNESNHITVGPIYINP